MNPFLGTIGVVVCWRVARWARQHGHIRPARLWYAATALWIISTVQGLL